MPRLRSTMRTLITIGLATGFVAPAAAQTAMPTRHGGSGELTVYRDRNYTGPAVSVSRARPDLGLAWSIHSIRISRGTWELCSRPNFEGRCTRYDASRPNLPSRHRTVQSIRPVYDGGWELIGEREVSDNVAEDTIISWGHAKHRRVRICIEDHAVRFYDLEIHFFMSLTHQKVPVRTLIPAGQCTRDILVEGGARDLAMVKMTYETFSLGHARAMVQVYAQR